MRLLCAFLLLPAQEDLYAAMKDKIEKAKTLRVEYSIEVGSDGTLLGVLKAKGPDRWTFELKLQEFGRRGRRAVSLLCDGRKVVSLEGDGELPPSDAMGAEIRRGVVTSLIRQAFLIEDPSGILWNPPQIGAFQKGGLVKEEGREVQILEYTLTYEGTQLKGEAIPVKLWVDVAGKIPLKREIAFNERIWKETITRCEIDGDIPDSEFSFQSAPRLAQARAAQLADSVRLFGQFTGRHPASLDDLVKRPAWLEADVFWPEGGFIVGGVVPKGFELRRGADGLRVAFVEATAPVPAVSRRAIGAPSERLKKHYSARVQIQLLASAVRAFRTAYGELPKKKEALWEKPEWVDVWPEGGWIPQVPDDPWGEPYRIVSNAAVVRLQVNDPKARALKALTAEEKAALERIAQPRLTEADRKEIGALLDLMVDDDLETREKGLAGLKAWGPSVTALLDARVGSEKDEEARGRLQAARHQIPSPPPPYLGELAPLSLAVVADPGRSASNERNASATLKTLATAEADFRANDRDNNRVNDFWTGDVAGLYTFDPGGGSIKLIELSVALADAAPLEKGAAAGKIPALTDSGVPAPKAGYYYRAMTHDKSSGKAEPYGNETGGEPAMGKVHNASAFGFSAYPAEYGVTGTRTFIISEANTIFCKDTQGEPVLEWPSDEELAAGWSKLD